MTASIFVGKKRGPCVASPVIDGTMPDNAERLSGMTSRSVFPEAACGDPGLSRKQARIRATITGMPAFD